MSASLGPMPVSITATDGDRDVALAAAKATIKQRARREAQEDRARRQTHSQALRASPLAVDDQRDPGSGDGPDVMVSA